MVSFAQSYASLCLEFHCCKTPAIVRKSVSTAGTLGCLLAGYLLLQVSQVSVPPLFELASFQVNFNLFALHVAGCSQNLLESELLDQY